MESKAYVYWSNAILLLAFVVIFYTPYRLAFVGTRTSFELAIDIVFISNMALHLVHFYSPIELYVADEAADEGSWWCGGGGGISRLRIMTAYCKHWRFLVDLVGAIPWDFIAQAAGDTSPRLSFGLGFLRIARMVGILQALSRAEKNVAIPYYVLRICGFLIYIAVESHWFACIFYFVGETGEYETSWLRNVELTKLGHLPSDGLGRYLLSLYWALQTSATLGYGDVTPQNQGEYVVIVVYIAVNVFTSAYLIGNMTNLLSSSGEEVRQFRTKFSALEQFMTLNFLPVEMRESMRSYMQL